MAPGQRGSDELYMSNISEEVLPTFIQCTNISKENRDLYWLTIMFITIQRKRRKTIASMSGKLMHDGLLISKMMRDLFYPA